MAKATIKKEFKDTVVAFGSSGKPLGERKDLNDLAILAHQSGNKNLLQFFDELPSLEDLQKARVEKKLVRHPKA